METDETSALEEYQQQGYYVARGLLDPEYDLQPVVEEYEGVLAQLMDNLFERGEISDTYNGLAFSERFTELVMATGSKHYSHFAPKNTVHGIKHGHPMHLGPAVFQLLRHRKVMDVAEIILGPEIVCSPLNNVRIKPPERLLPRELQETYNPIIGKTNWHQDLYNFSEEADATNFLTIWIPITPATINHGCMVVVPGSHKGNLNIHCPSRDPSIKGIPEELVGANPAPVPMEPGDVLYMHKLTEHTALSNLSDTIRFSFDLRYSPLGEPSGMPGLPSWVVRSRTRPETEMSAVGEWERMWMSLKYAPDIDYGDVKRGNPEHPLCVEAGSLV